MVETSLEKSTAAMKPGINRNPRLFNLAIIAVILATALLLAACGGGPGKYTDAENTVPASLLPRTPFLIDSPVPFSEVLEQDIEPYVITPLAMEPGQAFRFAVIMYACCVVAQLVEAEITWRVHPQEGASIDPSSGLLKVDPATSHGSVFKVSADVENGAYNPSTEVTVITREENPLAGSWREGDTGNVGELLFTADGQYAATWTMLEDYMDLFGTYELDTTTGTVELNYEWDRIETAGFSGTGSYRIEDDGSLVLEGICSGGPDSKLGTGEEVCTHRFLPRS